MNEPLETVVRLVRGEPSRRADRRSRRLPGRPRPRRRARAGRIWPQSRGSQVAGLAVGSSDGERVLDLCAAPGGKTTQLNGDVIAVEIDQAARASSREPARRSRNNVAVVVADGDRAPAGARPASTARFSTHLARASACSRRGRTCAGARRRCPSCSLRCFTAPPSAFARAARSSTASARCMRRKTRRSSRRPGWRSTQRSARSGRSSAHPRRPEFLLTLPHVHRTSGFFVARLRA